MDSQKLDFYFSSNAKYFSPVQMQQLREKMTNMDDAKFAAIPAIELKDPSEMLLFSIFLGELGVDRFIFGNTGMGVLKLLTGGCCGVLWIIDIINSKKMTWQYNYDAVNTALMI